MVPPLVVAGLAAGARMLSSVVIKQSAKGVVGATVRQGAGATVRQGAAKTIRGGGTRGTQRSSANRFLRITRSAGKSARRAANTPSPGGGGGGSGYMATATHTPSGGGGGSSNRNAFGGGDSSSSTGLMTGANTLVSPKQFPTSGQPEKLLSSSANNYSSSKRQVAWQDFGGGVAPTTGVAIPSSANKQTTGSYLNLG